jgi:holo-[acyl-carrier protein] synthase
MIIGIGCDIIEIERIKKAAANPRFMKKVFTESEIAEIGTNYARAAGFFAAKEAVSKALGTGFRGFSFRDIEIVKDALGKPRINYIKKETEPQNSVSHISISHSDGNATAFCVIETQNS